MSVYSLTVWRLWVWGIYLRLMPKFKMSVCRMSGIFRARCLCAESSCAEWLRSVCVSPGFLNFLTLITDRHRSQTDISNLGIKQTHLSHSTYGDPGQRHRGQKIPSQKGYHWSQTFCIETFQISGIKHTDMYHIHNRQTIIKYTDI